MKYLVAGLGNIGDEYHNTRHNIGFDILDAYTKASNIVFSHSRYGSVANMRLKGKQVFFLKPSTYMNLSGKAISYWLKKEQIEIGNLLVIVDDIALPMGTIRYRAKGSDGGHNGLFSIINILGSNNFARLRFGIGNQYAKGAQVDYVLGKWSSDEWIELKPRIELAAKSIETFILEGISEAMNQYNNK